MPDKQIRISEQAANDLAEIGAFIGRDSMDAALRLVNELYEQMYKLGAMPGMGHRSEDVTKDEALVFWPVDRYVIVYRPDYTPL